MAPQRQPARRTNAAPTWEVQFTQEFQNQLRKAPDSVYKGLVRNDYERLKSCPCDGPEIKPLKSWKQLYRLRIGQHRVVYRADRERQQVTLLKVGHRKNIYERLGHDPDRDTPCARIIADPRARGLIDQRSVDHDATSIGTDAPQLPSAESTVPARRRTRPESISSARSLPSHLNSQLLRQLGINDGHCDSLLACKTENDLVNCGVPDGVLERVLDALWPDSLVRSVDAPRRVVDSVDDLQAVVDGARPWESLLLALDDTQKPFVKKFTGRRPRGPWLLKGGPGSGKSTGIRLAG